MHIQHPFVAESPPSGEHFVFHTSYRGPHKLFRFTWTLAPGKSGPGEHGRGVAWCFTKLGIKPLPPVLGWEAQ